MNSAQCKVDKQHTFDLQSMLYGLQQGISSVTMITPNGCPTTDDYSESHSPQNHHIVK